MTAIGDAAAATRRRLDRCRLESDPFALAERLDEVRQTLDDARRTGDDGLVAGAWQLHLMTLLEAEQVAEIDATLGELHAWCAARGDGPERTVLDWFRALRAILDGDPELAETLLATAVSPRQALGPLTTIRCFQGRFDELETRYRDVRRNEPAQSSPVVMLAWLWAQQGRLTAARGAVDTLGAIEALPRDRDWLARITQLAELSILFDDRPMAERLYRTLRPFERRIVLIGDGLGCWGSTDRSLGMLCRFLGRFDDAERHFRDKIALAAAAGAHPWLARGQLDLAELLLDMADDGTAADDGRAARLATAVRSAQEGIAAARRLDYPTLHERADALETRLRDLDGSVVSTVAQDRAPRPPVAATAVGIRLLGGFEAMTTAGEPAVWTSRKASELFCILLAARGRPVARERLMEHLWPGQAPHRLRNRLSVAISTVRRTLDPGGLFDREWFVSTTPDTVRSRVDNLAVDAESFLHAGAAAIATARTGRTTGALSHRGHAPESEPAAALAEALRHYAGEAFADHPYAEWAVPLREECLAMYVALLHEVISTSTSSLHRADAARRVLATDPYDESANTALAEALNDLGARGLAAAAIERYQLSL